MFYTCRYCFFVCNACSFEWNKEVLGLTCNKKLTRGNNKNVRIPFVLVLALQTESCEPKYLGPPTCTHTHTHTHTHAGAHARVAEGTGKITSPLLLVKFHTTFLETYQKKLGNTVKIVAILIITPEEWLTWLTFCGTPDTRGENQGH